jgi:hypothetical protein
VQVAKESPLLEAIARERLMTAGWKKGLAGTVVICKVQILAIEL